MSGRAELETGEVAFTVSLEAQATTSYRVRGTLTNPQGSTDNVLLLLLHGGSYTRQYWDWPYRPSIYSFVNWLDALWTGHAWNRSRWFGRE